LINLNWYIIYKENGIYLFNVDEKETMSMYKWTWSMKKNGMYVFEIRDDEMVKVRIDDVNIEFIR